MKYILTLFLCISSYISAYEHTVCVCCIFRDEARFLSEWIDFNLQQGVGKIYMYNNLSQDDYMEVLKPYIEKDQVALIDWPYKHSSITTWNGIQCKAYMHCAVMIKDTCEWCAFIDTDEFLFSPTGLPLPEILKNYSECDAIGVNWVIYGTSDIERIPDGEHMTDYLVMRAEMNHPVNTHVKSIVRPKRITGCGNPHYFELIKKSLFVNENKNRIAGPFSSHSVGTLRINHYWARDLDFFINHKLARQKEWHVPLEKAITSERSYNLVYDPILVGCLNPK